MKKEVIVLIGGWGLRLKPQVKRPKCFVEVSKGESLLDAQMEWLISHKFTKIVLAMDRKTYDYMRKHHSYYLEEPAIEVSIEDTKLGTGGAVKKASKYCSADLVYVMNGDDIVDSNPEELYSEAGKGAAILVTNPQIPFGKIVVDKLGNVLDFQEKPMGSFFVSTGHYVIENKLIKKYFPEKGNLELTVWQNMANDQRLRVKELKGRWITINSFKDLEKVRKEIEATSENNNQTS